MNKYYDNTDILRALFNQVITIQIMGGEQPKPKPKKITCTRRKICQRKKCH